MDKPTGMLEVCAVCGGKNWWTGREQRTPWTEPPFGRGPRTRIISAEYRCTDCGRAEWTMTGTETEGAD
jgi:hypothetical protein